MTARSDDIHIEYHALKVKQITSLLSYSSNRGSSFNLNHWLIMINIYFNIMVLFTCQDLTHSILGLSGDTFYSAYFDYLAHALN